MKFSWKWLNQIVNSEQITLKETVEKLTLAGFEIEEINNKKDINDTTLDLSITTNRSDAASIVGLARELNTIFKIQNFKIINKDIKTNRDKGAIQLESINIKQHEFINKNLSDIKLTIIQNIQLKKSPEWLIHRLKACDITPENTLYNIVKYINIKWGQDIEIFDLGQLDNQQFKIESITINSIDSHHILRHDNNRKIINLASINKNTFLETLSYKDKIVSLFGIKSNTEFYCNYNTSSILIVGHVCKPDYIQKTTRLLKYKTEKSQKHIKGLSRNDFLQAYKETIDLIDKFTSHSTNSALRYKWHAPYSKLNNILIDIQKIRHILGPIHEQKELTTQKIIDILNKLNFQPQNNNNILKITVPEHRSLDIKRPIDIIEEIGRIYGFNHFIDRLPQNKSLGHSSKTTILLKKIRNILRHLGLYEVIHDSFENIDNKTSGINISLYNPLQKDQTCLRYYLIYNLINTLKYNNKQNNVFMECFEIGKIFEQQLSLTDDRRLYHETIHLAGVIGKTNFSRRLWSEKGKELSWFQAKGLLETLFEQIHTKIEWTTSKNLTVKQNYKELNQICHPHRFAVLLNPITQTTIGIFGELNTKYSRQINKNQHNYIFELDLLELIKSININKHLSYIFKTYSHYPSVTRDICVTLNKNTNVDSIQKILLSHNTKFINSVKILNEYYLKDNIQGLRNISFRLTYRSHSKTLEDNDIQNIDKKLNKVLNNIKNLIN
nr:phenylalanine-tRNA ligase beta subunit [Hypnea sp.]